MEDFNPFPKFDLMPRLTRAANFIGRIVRNTNVPVPPYMSDHYHAEHFTGAEAMLDEALDAPQPPVEDGWCDMGTYFNPFLDRSRN
jgi:hypothetical protein